MNPSGDCLLTASADGTARIWSTRTGKCLRTFKHDAWVRRAVFNHRGDLLVTAADDGVGQIRKVDSGQTVGAPLPHPGQVRFAWFSADDEFLVAASSDELVRVWSTRDGSLHTAIAVGDVGSTVSCLAVSPQGSRGVSSCGNSHALVWDLKSGNRSAFELEHSDMVTSVGFSPDAAAVVTGGADGKAKVWDADSGRLLFEFPHSGAVKTVCFTSDSKHLVTATDDAAHIWPVDPNPSGAVTIVHPGLKAIAVDPAGCAIITVGNDRFAKLWSLPEGKSLGDPLFHAGLVVGAEFSGHGESVLTFSMDGTARTWNRADRLKKFGIAELAKVLKVDATPDRQWLFAWNESGVGAVFRADALGGRQMVFKHREMITAASTSSDGRQIAAADTDGNAIVWDRETGQTLVQPLPQRSVVRSVKFAAGKRIVATGDEDGNVAVYKIDTGQCLNSFRLPSSVIEVAFSPSENLLLAVDSKAVRLFQSESKQNLDPKTIELGGDILGARFSLDGRFVVIYGNANRVLVWDIVGGSLKSLRSGAPVTDASFTGNSSRLLTAAKDGTAQICAWSMACRSVRP